MTNDRINLFVYGTLKEGHGAHHYMKDSPLTLKNVKVRGKLYKSSFFPCLVLTPEEENYVMGEVYSVHKDNLPAIDRYEGYPSLFDRKKIEKITLEDGSTLDADNTWVYVINHRILAGVATEKDFQQITSGIW